MESLGLSAEEHRMGRSASTHSSPHQEHWNSELIMRRRRMFLHWKRGQATFHQLGLSEVIVLNASLIHSSYTEDKLLPSHPQP